MGLQEDGRTKGKEEQEAGGGCGVVGYEGQSSDNVRCVHMQSEGTVHLREGEEFADAALRCVEDGRGWFRMEVGRQGGSVPGSVKVGAAH
ncbi:hypothetical protein U1Q18_043068 [Sarracenia purpurea var. burkii]